MGNGRARTDEKVLNTKLADALHRLHPRWDAKAEQSGVLAGQRARKPDIVIWPQGPKQGSPLLIEVEYAPARSVEADAEGRLGAQLAGASGTVDQAVAVKAPQNLQTTASPAMASAIVSAEFEYALLRRNGDRMVRFPESGGIAGSVEDLAGFCERAALSDHLLEDAADAMETMIRRVTGDLGRTYAEVPAMRADLADALHQEDNEQTTMMGVAIVANAFLFQTALEGRTLRTRDGTRTVKVRPSVDEEDPLSANRSHVQRHWNEILAVNYYPIFDIANQVMSCIPHRVAMPIINALASLAAQLSGLGVTSTGDMAGQMFGKLITDRKFLATFYTLPSSAALLAELAAARLDTDWASGDSLKALRVADLACGTGALLTAAYQRILARARRAGLNDEELHPAMMQDALIGADIMPAAVHLTATLLSSVFPRAPFADTGIHLMPYGDSGTGSEIGSLELLEPGRQVPLWVRQQQISGHGVEQTHHVIDHHAADLVIMNPPFTRPTNHEADAADVRVPSFAGFSTTDDEQHAMAQRLKDLLTALKKISANGKANGRQIDSMVAGHGNVGLGSNFLDLAHAKVKPGGTIAFVLPFTVMSGKDWARARALLQQAYRNICVLAIATHGKTDRAFSADTGMAEVLIIADRRQPGDPAAEDKVLYVNLAKRPATTVEGVEIARCIKQIPECSMVGPLEVGDTRAGFYVRSSLDHGGCAGVVEMGLARCGHAMSDGRLYLPRIGEFGSGTFTRLGELGQRGPVHRDVNGKPPRADKSPRGPFDIEELSGDWGTAEYPMLWGHDHRRETQMTVAPDRQGTVRAGMGDKALRIWATSSRLHFSSDFRLNSQPLAACLTPKHSIGGRAWPSFTAEVEDWEKPLALWANSTLGLIAWWWIGTRQQEGRATVTISRLPDLPVLDVRKLTAGQIRQAAEIFDDFENRELLPANEAYRDETRKALDEAVMTDLLHTYDHSPAGRTAVLNALETLRNQWCSEPSVHGGQPTGLGITA